MILITTVGLIILGWLSGAFVNYLADVLPVTRRLNSADCPVCGHPRRWVDFLLMARCKQCGARRTRRAWIVQILAVGAAAAQYYVPSPRLGFWAGVLLVTYFGMVAVIDIEHRLILHPTSLAGAVLCGILGINLHGWQSTLTGGLIGFAIMAGLYWLGWLLAKGLGKLRGQVIEEDALGFGDIILCAVLGLILGWPGIALGVFYTILIAGAGSLLIILWQVINRRYQAFTAVAFGPYLLLAALLLLYMPR